jgi:XrtN system VIT domain protein
MYLLKKRLNDQIYRAGLGCIAISLFLFCLPFIIAMEEQAEFGLFVFNFSLTGIYFLIRVVNRKQIEKEKKIHHLFLLLILFLISAYSLNREIPVFENSVNWFAGLLILLCINYVAFALFDSMPQWARHSISFINGAGFITFLYLSIYLLPLLPIGVIGAFLLGVSLHVFVPLLFTIYTMIFQNRVAESSKKYWISFSAGLLAVLSFIIIYLIQWSNTTKKINTALYESRKNEADLPAWTVVSKKIPRNNIAKKILKAGLVYSVPQSEEFNFFWGMPGRNFGEEKRHDPLVMMAAFFVGKPAMVEEDRIKVLESMYDMRHQAQERLWSGDHLYTAFVNTEIKLWPNCNMVYTEKTITVTNDELTRGWNRQEEAIYTFYMPEGAVVTSLSLWVQGKEEKGILTTKALADSAYQAIVGVERRDPSVVHWQEGNTVSVRVFPVIAGESRMFKLGITAPLERVDGKLRYENIYFKGPAFDKAKENILIDFEQPNNDFQVPASFVSMPDNQSYKKQGKYSSEWSMQLNDPGLFDCSFSFGGNKYALLPYHKRLSSAQLNDIYLDVNDAWTKEEYNKALEYAEGKNVFVYFNEIIKVDESNKEMLWEKLKSQQFSLFPLYEIVNPDQSLIITKSSPFSPNLDDLRKSGFMQKTKQFLAKSHTVKLFNIGDDLTPYLKSLKELRVFQYDAGDLNMLHTLLQKNQFAEDIEDDNNVIIHRSEMVIHKTQEEAKSSGPDHLMRLFSYNHIMQKLGKDWLTDRPIEDSLVQEARKAYVVSPVSSLIVLETQKDYDRFNIKDSDNSLKNATLKSKGAVPEPHEWVLIILAAISLLIVIRRNKPQVGA